MMNLEEGSGDKRSLTEVAVIPTTTAFSVGVAGANTRRQLHTHRFRTSKWDQKVKQIQSISSHQPVTFLSRQASKLITATPALISSSVGSKVFRINSVCT